MENTNGTSLVNKAPTAPAAQRIVSNDDSAMATLLDTAKFEHLWRVSKLFAASNFIPEAFQGKPENCFIALQLACQLKMQPFTLFNTLYIIHGKPAFEAKMLIAMANSSGIFEGPIRYKYSGQGDKRACTAFAKMVSTGETVEQTVSIELAKAEGWYDKKDRNGNLISKWRTMPDLMLAYRAASWLIRLYCPEVMYGFTTKEEAEDIIDITPVKKVSAAEKLNSDNAFAFINTENTEKEILGASQNETPEIQAANTPNSNENSAPLETYSQDKIEALISEAGLKDKTAVLTNLYKTVSEKPLIEWTPENWHLLGKTLEEIVNRNKAREEQIKKGKESK